MSVRFRSLDRRVGVVAVLYIAGAKLNFLGVFFEMDRGR